MTRVSDGQEANGLVQPEAVWRLHFVEIGEQACRF